MTQPFDNGLAREAREDDGFWRDDVGPEWNEEDPEPNPLPFGLHHDPEEMNDDDINF